MLRARVECGITDFVMPMVKRTEPAWARPMGKTARRRARRRVLFIIVGVLVAVVVASFSVVVVERLLFRNR